MIATIHGQVSYIGDDSLIVEVGGLGFQLYVPAPLRIKLRVGDTAYIFTYLVVRQDALTLYGFETMEERVYFGLLLGVNGIGPRLALSILSSMTPDAIRRAVFTEQIELFSRVPGVGRKTAQKVILYLQDHIKAGLDSLQPASATSEIDAEVVNGLIALGYSVIEAQTATQNIPKNSPEDLESRLRIALQSLAR
jgi:Holliday junction DNA helicase RuvA